MVAHIAHIQIESARIDLPEILVAAQRDRDRYSWIIALELHTSRGEQVIKLIHVQRSPRFTQEDLACLSDRPVCEACAHRLTIDIDRRDAPVSTDISHGISTIRP